MHDGNDGDRLRIFAIEDAIGKPSEERPPRVAMKHLIELRVGGNAVERRLELGTEPGSRPGRCPSYQ
jgi:hypothetical protein